MSGVVILGAAILIFVIAYVTYGSWLAKQWGVDPKHETPAHTEEDGVDFVPAKAPVLLGHHFHLSQVRVPSTDLFRRLFLDGCLYFCGSSSEVFSSEQCRIFLRCLRLSVIRENLWERLSRRIFLINQRYVLRCLHGWC